jgi:hypothetical protein
MRRSPPDRRLRGPRLRTGTGHMYGTRRGFPSGNFATWLRPPPQPGHRPRLRRARRDPTWGFGGPARTAGRGRFSACARPRSSLRDAKWRSARCSGSSSRGDAKLSSQRLRKPSRAMTRRVHHLVVAPVPAQLLKHLLGDGVGHTACAPLPRPPVLKRRAARANSGHSAAFGRSTVTRSYRRCRRRP